MRGLKAVCTVCGAERLPTSVPVNVAGKPSRVGGTVASAAGVTVLLVGLFLALLVGALLQAIFPAGIVGWVVALPIAFFALAIGIGLLFGGRSLKKSGDEASLDAKERAVFAIARSKDGLVTAADVAPRLGVSTSEADAFLTALAKRGDGKVSLEVEDDGRLVYVFRDVAPARVRARFATSDADRLRIETSQGTESEAAADEERARRWAPPTDTKR